MTQSVFDPQTFQELVRRIESLRADSTRQWGKMTASQMLEHTARAADMATGRTPRPQAMLGKLIGWIFKKDFLGEKPFPKSSPTGPDFIIKDEPDFAASKQRLLTALRQLHDLGERGVDGHVHGFFGALTGPEWGVSQFKHVDHHLRQFGA